MERGREGREEGGTDYEPVLKSGRKPKASLEDTVQYASEGTPGTRTFATADASVE